MDNLGHVKTYMSLFLYYAVAGGGKSDNLCSSISPVCSQTGTVQEVQGMAVPVAELAVDWWTSPAPWTLIHWHPSLLEFIDLSLKAVNTKYL